MITKEVASVIKETTIIVNKNPATDADSSLFSQSNQSSQHLLWLQDPDQSNFKEVSRDRLEALSHDLFSFKNFKIRYTI